MQCNLWSLTFLLRLAAVLSSLPRFLILATVVNPLADLLFQSSKLFTMWRVLAAMVMIAAINMKWGECIERMPFGGVWNLDGIVKTDGDLNIVVQVRELFSLCSILACSSAFIPPPTSRFSPAALVLWRYAATTLLKTFSCLLQ